MYELPKKKAHAKSQNSINEMAGVLHIGLAFKCSIETLLALGCTIYTTALNFISLQFTIINYNTFLFTRLKIIHYIIILF